MSVTRRYLRAKRVIQLLDISRSQFYALIARGDFPKGTQISPGCVVWEEADVFAWVAEREARGAQPPTLTFEDREERRRLAVQANANRAKVRWAQLEADCTRRGLTIEKFAELRCNEGPEPFSFKTSSGKPRFYSYDTIVRELGKLSRNRRRACP